MASEPRREPVCRVKLTLHQSAVDWLDEHSGPGRPFYDRSDGVNRLVRDAQTLGWVTRK